MEHIRKRKRTERKPLVERFWAKVDKREENDCWPWIGARDGRGYGMIGIYEGVPGKMRLEKAHRLSLILAGLTFPDGMHALHHCDNPPCVNPSHLYIGTPKQNMRDGFLRDRFPSQALVKTIVNDPSRPRGGAHHNAKLTNEQAAEIRRRYSAKEANQFELAEEYGVNRMTILRIINNRSYLP